MEKKKQTATGEVFMNPRPDFGFRKIFMDRELLIDFLNGLIGERAQITGVEYLPNTVAGEWDADRKAVFDLYCTNSEGEYFIVEMQRCLQPHFIDRSLFYASAVIRSQAPAGKWDYRLKAVYFIAVLDFVEFTEADVRESYVEQACLYRRNAQRPLSDKLNMLYIELPKFKKTPEELTTNADRWFYLLKNLEKLKDRPPEVQGRIFEKLFKRAQINRLTTKEMEEYKTSVLEYDSIKSAIAYSKERGIEEGIEKGERIGMEKARREIIKRLLRGGFSIETVSSITGLGVEEIRDMEKDIPE
ncbi:MAG: Rpn family recombination-promoting nuclease/putative transposase [Tannerella sp.]|jgi:predicted transposase/invertase (TIGR01784 family)|nr:Rpn family recombination-promoting nuclease/putative transposase [Tannerella sp.]